MNNWTIYQIVNYLINKSQVGNPFSPSEFQDELNYNSLKLYKRRLGMPEEYQLQTAYVQQGYAQTERILIDLKDFIVIDNISFSSGDAAMPSAMLYPINMEYKRADSSCDGGYDSRLVELVDEGELIMRKQSYVKKISYAFPVYHFVGETMKIIPKDIQRTDFTFLKHPENAVFTTTTSSSTGELEYDSANSTELEWNDLAKLDIISMILFDVGINLRANDILQAANGMKQQGI